VLTGRGKPVPEPDKAILDRIGLAIDRNSLCQIVLLVTSSKNIRLKQITDNRQEGFK